MKLAINYSEAARGRLEEGLVDFDVWKSAPRCAWMKEVYSSQPSHPVYLHFPLDLGEPDFGQRFDWQQVVHLLEETKTFFVNVHLNARRAHFPELGQGSCSQREQRKVRDRFLRHLEVVTTRFGAERVIAENVIYRGEEGPYLRASVEPELICEVVQESGCGFLLDTAHAQMTCYYLGGGHKAKSDFIRAYLSALPCRRLCELHVTGVQKDETGRWRDSMPLTTGDWDLVKWVLARIEEGTYPRPWCVALEYGGIGPIYDWRSDPDVIAEQLPMLHTLVAALEPHSSDGRI